MLLPDNVRPELSIYYNGYIVLQELKNKYNQPIFELYQSVKNKSNMSISTFVLSLDWLYLIDMAILNQEGIVELCL